MLRFLVAQFSANTWKGRASLTDELPGKPKEDVVVAAGVWLIALGHRLVKSNGLCMRVS